MANLPRTLTLPTANAGRFGSGFLISGQTHFDTLQGLTSIGQLLIAARIANGLSQRELADRLGVSETQVSRDERNEYHGITVERAQRILDCLNETVTVRPEAKPEVPAT
ncbi:MAG TPA: helix-turn-helix transcriptional regulator [Chloroflexota bacterium]|nr:helix-turn-helix transcriptional regulator [Chloroflexota bacterium]